MTVRIVTRAADQQASKAEKAEAAYSSSPPVWLASIRTMWAKSCVAFEGTELKQLGLGASSISCVRLLLMPLSRQHRAALPS